MNSRVTSKIPKGIIFWFKMSKPLFRYPKYLQSFTNQPCMSGKITIQSKYRVTLVRILIDSLMFQLDMSSKITLSSECRFALVVSHNSLHHVLTLYEQSNYSVYAPDTKDLKKGMICRVFNYLILTIPCNNNRSYLL